MQVIDGPIPGLKIFSPAVFEDSRGYFFESYQHDRYKDALGAGTVFVQDNEAKSQRGVLRGLHYQVPPFDQAKLVRVVTGSVLDVAVDIRADSPTRGQWCAIELNDRNKKQMFIPRGFAHGYLVLEEDTIFCYKCDNYYSRAHEGGLRYNDPVLNIHWQLPTQDLIISEKDLKLPEFGKHRTI